MGKPNCWRAQERQNSVACSIQIDGVSDWKSLFEEEVEATGFWAVEAGGEKVSLLALCTAEARVNDVSTERSIFAHLMSQGFVLEELEIQFEPGRDNSDWGVCTWMKEHEAYKDPASKVHGFLQDPNEYIISLFDARFQTGNSGEQAFSLASMQMLGAAIVGQKVHFLFHKSIIFRHVRFSQPRQAAKQD